MGLKKEEVTIASVDAINMYPSIKLAKKFTAFYIVASLIEGNDVP